MSVWQCNSPVTRAYWVMVCWGRGLVVLTLLPPKGSKAKLSSVYWVASLPANRITNHCQREVLFH